MNLSAAVSVVAAVVGLAVAGLAFGVGRTPRWSRYRRLGVVALMAALFCFGELPQSLFTSPALIFPIAHVQSVFAVLHVLAWQHYADRHLELRPGRIERALRAALFCTTALWLVPGLMYGRELSSFPIPALGCRLTFPSTTTLGSIGYLCELLMLVSTCVRYVRAARRGVPTAKGHVAAISAILLAAAHDACVTVGVYHGPFALSTGFLVSVGALGVILTRDFIGDAEELDRLKQQLEQRVELRTAELVRTEAALMRSEKLAALGQLSAGVAHEVNNPAAVVRGNLGWLREELENGALPPDAIPSIDDSLEAIERIAKIVRQLLDLGRAASGQTGSCMLARAVDGAIAMSKTALRPGIELEVDVADELWVRADEASVVQILVNLLVNAAQAVPEGRAGKLRILASEVVPSGIRVRVIDDGTGMSEETRRRIFEPFFTTKPFGQGTGLGLSLSLGIARSLGGTLDCDSRPGETVMTLTLPRADAVQPISERRRTAAARRSLLLVEDDERVRKALARMLSTRFTLEVATGVDDAMSRLARSRFDVVLSDWRMPNGGGRRLYEEAVARQPDLGASFMFVTGGGHSPEDEAFLARHFVLDKPLALDKLLEAVEERVA